MSESSLVSYRNCTSGKWNSRSGNPIRKIIIHHCAGVWSIERMNQEVNGTNRQMSCHYCVGSDGRIGQYVSEAYRSWCSSGWEADKDSVTIETSNSAVGGNWPVSDVVLAKLIDLVADICRRNGITPSYTGDKRGTIQYHQMWANTACPGPYLKSKMQYICDQVKAKLNGGTVPTPAPTPAGKINVVYQSYDSTHGWLTEVTNWNNQNTDGYSGWLGYPIKAFRAKTPGDVAAVGNLEYRVHCLGGGWYDWRRDYEVDSAGDTFAGTTGTNLDGLQMRIVNISGKNVRYRVHCIGKGWLDWVTNYGDGNEGYAGWYGYAIDAVQVEVV